MTPRAVAAWATEEPETARCLCTLQSAFLLRATRATTNPITSTNPQTILNITTPQPNDSSAQYADAPASGDEKIPPKNFERRFQRLSEPFHFRPPHPLTLLPFCRPPNAGFPGPAQNFFACLLFVYGLEQYKNIDMLRERRPIPKGVDNAARLPPGGSIVASVRDMRFGARAQGPGAEYADATKWRTPRFSPARAE